MTRLKVLVLGVLVTLFLSACEASVYSLPLPGGPDVGEDPMTVKVEFADVSTWCRSPPSRSTT